MKREAHPLSPEEGEFLEQVVLRHQRLMYATAGKYTSDPDDRADIVQEAMTRLVENIEKIRSLSCNTLAAYLVNIVRSAAVDYLRREGRHRNRAADMEDEDWTPDMLPDESLSVEARFLQEDDIRFLREIWGRLDEESQFLLRGKYILDLTSVQIAQALGWKPVTVRVRLLRLQRQLLKIWREERGEDHNDKT